MIKLTGEYLFKNDQFIKTDEFRQDIPEDQRVYEVLRVIEGAPLFLTEHLNRLFVSLKLLTLDKPVDFSILRDLEARIERLIRKNSQKNCNLKIIVTPFDSDRAVDCYGFFIPSSYPPREYYQTGVDTILYQGIRNNPNAKVYQSDLREAVAKRLREEGAYEALLVDSRGEISEGSRSNVFFVKNQTVYTSPPKQVLLGITREKILGLLEENGIECELKEIHQRDLPHMTGAFMTGTSPKVLPLRSIGEYSYNSASDPVIQRIMALYQALIEREIRDHQAKKPVK